MANVTRDSYDASKGFTTLRYQRGKPVLDAELNEAQDVAQGLRGFKAQDLREEGVSELSDFELGNFSAGDFDIDPGTLSREGIRYELSSVTAASALGLVLTAADPAQDRIDTVYLELREEEVNAAMDPTIAVGTLGESSVRRRLTANLAVVEGTPGGAEGVVPASTGTLVAGGIARIPFARLQRAAGSGTTLSSVHQKILPISRALKAWQNSNTVSRISAGVGWNRSSGDLSLGDPTNLPSTTDGYLVDVPGGGQNSVAGNWSLGDGDALWIIPNRFTTGGQTFYHTPTGVAGDPRQLTAYTSPLEDPQPDGAFVVCVRKSYNLVLANGTIVGPPSREGSSATNWVGPEANTSPRDGVTWSLGADADRYYPQGDFSGPDALATVAVLVSLGAVTALNHLTLRFLPGTHLCSAAAAATDTYAHFDLSAGTGSMSLRFEGESRETTVIAADMTNINTDGAWLRVTGNSPTNTIDVSCQGVHFLEVAATRSNSNVSLVDLPAVTSWDAYLATFNGSNAVRSGHSATGLPRGADTFQMRRCNVAVGDALDTQKGVAVRCQPTSATGTRVTLEDNTFLGAGETCGEVHISRFETVDVRRNALYVAGGALALDAPLFISKFFTADTVYPSRHISVVDNEFMFLSAESTDRSTGISIDMPTGRLDVSRNIFYAQPVDTNATGSGQRFRWPQISVFDSTLEGFAAPSRKNSVKICDNVLSSEEVLTRVASARFGCIQLRYSSTSRNFIRSAVRISGNEISWSSAPADAAVYPAPVYVERAAASGVGLIVDLNISYNMIKEAALGGGYYFGAISVLDLALANTYQLPVIHGNVVELSPDNHPSADVSHCIYLEEGLEPSVIGNSLTTRNVAPAAGENSACIYLADGCTEGVVNSNQLKGTIAVRTGPTQFAFITGNNSRLAAAGGGLTAYALGVNTLQANNRIV